MKSLFKHHVKKEFLNESELDFKKRRIFMGNKGDPIMIYADSSKMSLKKFEDVFWNDVPIVKRKVYSKEQLFEMERGNFYIYIQNEKDNIFEQIEFSKYGPNGGVDFKGFIEFLKKEGWDDGR